MFVCKCVLNVRSYRLFDAYNNLVVLMFQVSTWDTKYRYCSIIFDEIALQPGLTYTNKDNIKGFVHLREKTNDLADHALVFMIKGAVAKWHQPIAYYFCKGSTPGHELKNILNDIVSAVGESGLIPIALISDQGSSFQSTFNILQNESRGEHGNTGKVSDIYTFFSILI